MRRSGERSYKPAGAPKTRRLCRLTAAGLRPASDDSPRWSRLLRGGASLRPPCSLEYDLNCVAELFDGDDGATGFVGKSTRQRGGLLSPSKHELSRIVVPRLNSPSGENRTHGLFHNRLDRGTCVRVKGQVSGIKNHLVNPIHDPDADRVNWTKSLEVPPTRKTPVTHLESFQRPVRSASLPE